GSAARMLAWYTPRAQLATTKELFQELRERLPIEGVFRLLTPRVTSGVARVGVERKVHRDHLHAVRIVEVGEGRIRLHATRHACFVWRLRDPRQAAIFGDEDPAVVFRIPAHGARLLRRIAYRIDEQPARIGIEEDGDLADAAADAIQ